MKTITIKELANGYQFDVKGSIKSDGEFVAKHTEEYVLLERIGEVICGYKVKVDRR